MKIIFSSLYKIYNFTSNNFNSVSNNYIIDYIITPQVICLTIKKIHEHKDILIKCTVLDVYIITLNLTQTRLKRSQSKHSNVCKYK